MKNSLRSGDIWVQGSRQFKDFEDYLMPTEKFASLKQSSELPPAVDTDCDRYLHDRLTLLEAQLATFNRVAVADALPDATITESGLAFVSRRVSGAWVTPSGSIPRVRQAMTHSSR